MRVVIKGLSQTIAGLERAKARTLEAAGSGLYAEGHKIMGASAREVPIDTGALLGSGLVNRPQPGLGSIAVELGYGYGDETNPKTGQPVTGYAIYVHERTGPRHKSPRKAKFLEDPAKAAEAGFATRIGAFIRARLGV
ncbi:MAG: hypothetical protein KGL39_17535 [Patescibacteria group bacterium]|nr:hypothetical protein [Patescibacteria group bacterium]